MDLKKYILYKLFFPKIAVIDNPGIITNKAISKFGEEKTKTRSIYQFEEIGINLYLDTLKKLGKEKTGNLWYKIGKESGIRYSLFANGKDSEKIPKIILPSIIKYIFSVMNTTGLSFAEEISYEGNKRLFIATGKNCLFCRENENNYMIAGIASGILSSLLRENIEAEPLCKDCPNNCKIVASPKITKRDFPNVEELRPMKGYGKLNFPLNYKSDPEFRSFTDLLRFKKISIGEEKNLFSFQGKTIMPIEVGLSEIPLKNYSEINEFDLFKKSVIKTSEKIAEDILKNEKNIKDKIKSICMMMSAFGWGLPFHKKEKNKVTFRFVYPPITRFGPLFRGFILTGYLNNIYGKKFKIEKITNEKIIFYY